MICTIAFCAKNKDITVRLMNWLAELGWLDKHDCLLGVHTDTNSSGVIEVASKIFRRAAEFPIDDPETIYPFIANVMWKRCAMHIADMNESAPWFWLEPDAVPLVPEWLDWIEAEYKRAGKPFLLDRVITPTSAHNSGTGVYPARVRDYTMQLWNLSNVPWDVFFKDDFTPHTQHTTLIHDKFYAVWDDPKSGEPTFPDAASLAQIESGAVLFHRNKDGTLIERLREARGNRVYREAMGTASAPAGFTPLPAEEIRKIEPKNAPWITAIEVHNTEDTEVYFSDGTKQLVKADYVCLPDFGIGFGHKEPKQPPTAKAAPKARGKRMKTKPKRSAAEQAKIDARMAKLRARKKLQPA